MKNIRNLAMTALAAVAVAGCTSKNDVASGPVFAAGPFLSKDGYYYYPGDVTKRYKLDRTKNDYVLQP